MKNQLSTFTFFFFALLVSCTNDNEPVIINKSSIDSDVISAKSIATDTSYISYMTYIHQLEQNFEGKTIYHNYNRPDFSKEIEHLKSMNSKEIETPAFSANTRISSGISFGPWGGNGGASFDAPATLSGNATWKKILAIKVKHGAVIDAIQVYWVDSNNIYTNSAHFGGNGGAESWMFLANNEYITSLQVSSGGKVDKLVFTTNLNKVYVFGGSGGDWTSVDFGNIGLQMHGIYGKSGKKVDQIGIYCYPNSMFE